MSSKCGKHEKDKAMRCFFAEIWKREGSTGEMNCKDNTIVLLKGESGPLH